MAKNFEDLGPLEDFIERQKMFFVATAPLAADGLVNLSPKGLDTFRILGPREVAYLDLTGSGIETVAHVKENGRIVFMFCAFEGPPRILRLHGTGEVLQPGADGFDELLPRFTEFVGTRAIVRANIDRIADSCGFAVPLYSFEGDRDQLLRSAEARGPERLHEKRREWNSQSLDGLPGLRFDE